MRKKILRLILIAVLIVILTMLSITAIFLCIKNKNIAQQSASMSATINKSETMNAEGLLKNVTDAESMKHNTEYLQSLIDQVSNAGGGTVHIPDGTYYFIPNYDREDGAKYTWIGDNKDRAYYIIMCKDNVTVEGTLDANGNKATILKPFGKDMELSINMFHYISDDFVYLDNADFNNFIIDSSDTWKKSSVDYLAHGKGFMIAPYKNCDWNNVEVRNTDGTGFGMDFPINSTIKNCLAVGCGKAATEDDVGASGFGIGTGYSEEESISIENCTAIGNRKFGFFFEHQGRFRSDITAITAKGFNVENCTASGNMYNFGGERANDVKFLNCTSNVTGEENPLENTNLSGFYFGTNSRRIGTEGCKVNYVFTDVADSSKEYYKPVYWALNNAIIDGGARKTEFYPNQECPRAQAIVLLWRERGRQGNVVLANDNIDTGYKDVGNNELYTDAVIWGRDAGVIDYKEGEENKFNPDDPCLRATFITMLWKLAGRPEVEITYSLQGAFYEKAINWAIQKGIIGEELATIEECEKSATRGEIVTYLYRKSYPYTVTYNYTENGGTKENSSQKDSETKRNGEVIDLTPKATKSGYKFVGWNTNKDATNGVSDLVMGRESITLYAIYSKTLTATFNYYNGQSKLVSGTMYNKSTSVSVTIPSLINQTVDGTTYTPRGWATTTGANATVAINNVAVATLSSNQTYYASYQANITATYYYNNIHTSKSATAYMNYVGTKIGAKPEVIDDPTYSLANSQNEWSFRGWSTSTSPSASIITPGTITSNTNYYGSYEKTITLSYDANIDSGYISSGMPDNQTGTVFVDYANNITDASLTLSTLIPKRNDESYIFRGWNIKADGTGKDYEIGQIENFSSDTTLYAQWTETTPPIAEVSYSSTELTNQNVIATITSKEKEQLQEIEGWTLSKDKLTLTKEYSVNTTEIITVKDLAGNEVRVKIEIDNIDKTLGDIKKGDANQDGKIDTTDLLKMLRHIAAIQSEQTAQKYPSWKLIGNDFKAADINDDGKIDTTDTLKLLRHMAASKNEETANNHPDWILK